MAEKYNKPTNHHKRNRKTGSMAGVQRRNMMAVCILVVIFGIIIAIRAKTTIGTVFALVVCSLAVIAFLLLLFVSPRKKPSAGRTRENSSRAKTSGARKAQSRERIPVRNSGSTAFRRPVIDIPLDGEVRGAGKPTKETPQSRKSDDLGAPYPENKTSIETDTGDADVRSEARDTVTGEAGTPEEARGQGKKVVDFPTYKITPPKHNPDLFKRPDHKVVIWPGGRVVPVTESDSEEQVPKEEIDTERDRAKSGSERQGQEAHDSEAQEREYAESALESDDMHMDGPLPEGESQSVQESGEKPLDAADTKPELVKEEPLSEPLDAAASGGDAVLPDEASLAEPAGALLKEGEGESEPEGESEGELDDAGGGHDIEAPAEQAEPLEERQEDAAGVIYLPSSLELRESDQSSGQVTSMAELPDGEESSSGGKAVALSEETQAETSIQLNPTQESHDAHKDSVDVIYLPESLSGEPLAQEDAIKEDADAAGEEDDELTADTSSDWQYPPYDLLDQPFDGSQEDANAELLENAARLAETLKSFGVEAAAGDAVRGPAVTRYEFTLEPGVKLSKLTNLQDDIALALGASGVRIAPIPDRMSVVGVEVPNRIVSPVSIRSLLESPEFLAHPSITAFAVGKDISGGRIVGDIARFPHVLIAGTTGSGKSVCTNAMIVSMLYKSTPEEVRFIMVDPKMVELAPYNGIPHLLIPVVTDPKKAAGALQWAVYEMMKRYKLFSEHNVKDLAAYNALAEDDPSLQKLPTVVVVIDELADLMLIAAKEVEESICRVAQMGRAAGMHLVIATQSPRADVITGLMKANIPSRIAFAVASSLESRIILDNPGAEKLVGKGDMLYAPLGAGKPRRVQGCFISAAEIERVVEYLKAHGEANYDTEVIEKIDQTVAEKVGADKPAPEAVSEDMGDPLLEDAVDVILETGQASTSMLQRRLKLGYSRAARLVDQMEELWIVGPFEGSKPRKILVTRESWDARKTQMREDSDNQQK